MVIPHRNIPELLVRCLQSVPGLPYVHVLVVDNSDDDKKAAPSVAAASWQFGGLTVIEREPRNIGYIRNEALRYLREHRFAGKLVFADADDYFTSDATRHFERFKDADYDLVWFDVEGRDEQGNPASNADYVRKNIVLYNETGDLGALKYNGGPVWGKFISMALVAENDLWFQEIETCEDTFFSAMIGYYSDNQYVATPPLYIYVQREGSLVMTGGGTSAKTAYKAAYDTTSWLKERTAEGYYWTQYNVIWHWMNWCQKDRKACREFGKVYRLCDKKSALRAVLKVFKRRIKAGIKSKG